MDILEGLKDIKPGELVTREFKGGKLVKETRGQVGISYNAADLDIVLVGCECGNQYDTPWDCLMWLNDENSFCGQCGQSGKMRIIANPSPNRETMMYSIDHDIRGRIYKDNCVPI